MGQVFCQQLCGEVQCWRFDKVFEPGPRCLGEQRFDLGAQRIVIATGFGYEVMSLAFFVLQSCKIQFFDLLPALTFHCRSFYPVHAAAKLWP